MSKVVHLAQLTRELDFLFLFSPISIVCRLGLVLILVSLSLFAFLLLPAGLLIALQRGLCKKFALWEEGSAFAASAVDCLTDNW